MKPGSAWRDAPRSLSRRPWPEQLPALLGVALTFGAVSACDDAPPPRPAVAEPTINQRDWPEPKVDRATTVSAAEGRIIPAGGVGGGHWALSPDGTYLAHVGSPGEPNVVRAWSVAQGSWERQFLLPFYPSGPVGFSRDGRTLAVSVASGGLFLIPPSGELTFIDAGPCETITHIMSVPEGGWVVAGAGGCLARFRAGSWLEAPPTGIAVPLALESLTRGEPVLAGRTVNNRPSAVVWWPQGAPEDRLGAASQVEPAPAAAPPADATQQGAAQKAAPAFSSAGDVIKLALPTSGRIASWANITPTLVGSVYVAMEGVPLAAYEPSTGVAVGSPMPTGAAPWHPPRGAVVSQDGSSFYVIDSNHTLYGGPTALWEADWEVEIPGDDAEIGFVGSRGPLLVLGGEKTRLLDVGRWSSPPGPPRLVDRPWQPLELAFGNNGQTLAVTYAAPSIGGTARWAVLWTFEGDAPRRVGLGTLRHEATWEQFLSRGQPTTPLAANRVGTFFATMGPTLTQLFETSTGVRAGQLKVGGGLGLAFTKADDQLMVIDEKGALKRRVVRGEDEEGEALGEARWPLSTLARAGGKPRIAVGWGGAEAGGMDVIAMETGKTLGTMKLPAAPTAIALSSSGERGFAAVAEHGLYRWPGGDAVQKAQGPADQFTAVAFHPRTGEATFAGRDGALMRWTKAGRASPLGLTAGVVRDLVYHPLGRCVMAAVGGGRVELWNEEEPIVTLELWEGGRWVMWTHTGAALGTKELVDALRVRTPADLTRPYMASTAEIAKVIERECQ